MKPALFVQDIQNVWLYEPDSNKALRRSVEKRLDLINEAITWFRKKGLPVIVGHTVDKEIGLLPGTWSFEVPKTLKVTKSDLRVTKLHSSAFANPALGALFRRKKCDTIVIAGISASGCVLATYFSAPDWDINPYLLKGGVGSSEERHIKFAEEICNTITLDELAKSL